MSKDLIPAAKPTIDAEEWTAVGGVLQSGMLAQGSEVAAFGTELADVFAAGRETAAVNSGTSVLLCGLLAAGTGAGDEVIVSSLTSAATANPVALIGATPALVDIEPEYFRLDLQAVAAVVTERTKVILLIYPYGHPANMTALGGTARGNGLTIFEDTAQTHGATWNGQPVRTFGVFEASSLYPTESMTPGERGMITCETPELACKYRLYHNQGMEKQHENEAVGYNLRMANIHATIGREQLKKPADWTAKRRENAALSPANLQGTKMPATAPETTHAFHRYTVRVAGDRDGSVKALCEEYQIGSRVYHSIPNHRLPSSACFAPGLGLPATEAAARGVVSLSVHPSLDSEDLERIVTAMNVLAGVGA